MTSDDAVHRALIDLQNQVAGLDGKVTLLGRPQREQMIESVRETVVKTPLIGQIFLVLDGSRSQDEIVEALRSEGVSVVKSTLSTRIREMESEHGLAVLLRAAGGRKFYGRNAEWDKMLNLKKRIPQWLSEAGATVPFEKK